MKFENYIWSESYLDDVPTNGLLSESSFSRLLDKIYTKKQEFAIITAYRHEYTKKQNIQRNRKLRNILNSYKLGPYLLVGHWQECSEPDVEYKNCPKDKLVDVVERSYLVIRPEEQDSWDFFIFIAKLVKEFKQEGSLIYEKGLYKILDETGNRIKIGENLTLNKISQAYSQYVRKMNVPFVFEMEIPATNTGCQLFQKLNINYLRESDK